MPQQNELLPATPGELLCNARRKQGCTIAEVADYLKLGIDKIEAVEADQWSLLEPVYYKGFARRYARFLKLSTDGFEAALNAIDYIVPPVKSVFSQSTAEKTSALKSFKMLTYLVATVFIVLPLILAYTHFAVSWSQDEPLLAQSPFASGTVRAVTEPNTQPTAAKNELQHLQANMIPADIISTAGNAEQLNPAHRGGDTPGTLDIGLSADSWLSVTDADGRQLESALRKGGQVYSYQGTPPFQLQVGRVSATQVWLNGEQVDLQNFTSGDIANLDVGAEMPE